MGVQTNCQEFICSVTLLLCCFAFLVSLFSFIAHCFRCLRKVERTEGDYPNLQAFAEVARSNFKRISEESSMEMTLRWYGSRFDSVTLQQIRQIPGVTGVITTLYDTAPGDLWEQERIHALKEEVEASGLHISGIESVNIHDAIKIGLPERDRYIENYIRTLENLGKEDIHMVCYNFMPVFDSNPHGAGPRSGRTVPPFWPTARRPSTLWIRKKCLIPSRGIPTDM